MPNQTLQYDKRFQAKLVRALYQFPEEARQIVDQIDAHAFTVPQCAWLVGKLQWSWQTMHTAATEDVLRAELNVEERQQVVSETLASSIKRLLKLLEKPVPDKTYLFNAAHNFCRTAAVERFFTRHVEGMTKKGHVDWDAYDADLRSQVAFGARVDGGLGVNLFSNLDERIKRRAAPAAQGIPTGTIFDSYSNASGLKRKQIGTLMAPTGVGKTSGLTHMGKTALLAMLNVLHVTLEVDEDVICDRYDAAFSGIQLSKLHKKPKALRRALEAVTTQYHSNLQIRYWPPSSLSIPMLRSYIRRLEAAAFYPDLILVDYGDEMSREGFGKEEREHVLLGSIWRGLRSIAGEFNCAVWTATQTNREGMEKSRLAMSDCSESAQKMHVSDMVMGISQNEREARHKVARFSLLKNRNGPSGITHLLNFDLSRATIGEEVFSVT